MSVNAARAPHLVVMVLYDQVQLLDVTGPLDVYATANHNGARYRCLTVSPGGRNVRTSAGLSVTADAAIEEVDEQIGTLIVPGRTDWRAVVSDLRLVSDITRLSQRSRRVASVCAGAFPLAAAGILDGRRAATHWQLTPELEQNFPKIKVDRDAIFVRDGKIITSAGVTSGIDLTLSLVEEDFGPEVARATAKYLVVFMARPGGQSQFSARLDARSSQHDLVRTVLDAVTADPTAEHSREAIAARAGVSVRHLTRLFRTELDTTVARFVEEVRVEAAKTLLETSTDTLDVVARRSGFGCAETLRRAFHRNLGVTPTDYRSRFRSTRGDRT